MVLNLSNPTIMSLVLLGMYWKGEGLGLLCFSRKESRSAEVPNFHLEGVDLLAQVESCDPGPGISSSRASTKDAK